jgi:hypothetical protein
MLRDPVSRFVSGFNSRRRRGRSLNDAEWNQDEAAAFAAFPTANDLAEALSVTHDDRRAAAVAAMRGIYHVKSSYADWLVDVGYLESRRDDILWVGQTSRLAADFDRLKQILGLPAECVLPADPVASHRRLDSDETYLSPVGIKNIERWYATDYPFPTYFVGEASGGNATPGSEVSLAFSERRYGLLLVDTRARELKRGNRPMPATPTLAATPRSPTTR